MNGFGSADWVLIGRQVANHLWQSTLFAVVAGLLALSLRKNHARTRYWLWMAASVKFLVPFALIVAIGGYFGASLGPRATAPRIPVVAEQIAQPFALPADGVIVIPSAPEPSPRRANPLPGVIVAVWFCGFAAILVNWGRKWRRVEQIVSASAPLGEGREVELLRRVQRGGSPRLRLVSSAARLEPGIFGILRPVLWLPKGIGEYLSEAQLEAILAHELCHARRRDNLLAAIHMVVEACFWFHPLVWWVGARLEEERERACDEEVVQLGGEARDYAEGVLKVCEFYLASPLSCAAGVTGADLKRRIESIMTNGFTRKLTFGKKALLAGAAAVAVAGPIVVGLMLPPRSRAAGAAEIRGVVVEQGTNQPVTDAEVSLYFLGEGRPNIRRGLGTMQAANQTKSDYSGAFRFSVENLGYYTVAARKAGYHGMAHADVTLTEKVPTGNAELRLSRGGRIAGQVVDDMGKPVRGVHLRAWNAALLAGLASGRAHFYGRPGFGAGPTDAEGQFLIPDVAPGEYVIEVLPETDGEKRVLANFEASDLKRVATDYESTYWPGGHGSEASLPVKVDSGSQVDIGRISVRKVPYYAARVRLEGSACGPEDKLMVYEESGTSQIELSRAAPCGKELLVKGFPAGDYRLMLVAGTGRERKMASVPLTFRDSNLDVTASMSRGVTIAASFLTAKGARAPDYTSLQIMLRPEGMVPFADWMWKPDAEGKAALAGVPVLNQQIVINGVDAQHYIKEIRWNGAAVTGNILPMKNSDMAHDLAIVIDDKPAVVAGTVMDGDKPVARAAAILQKWPIPAGLPSSTGRLYAKSDGDGRFQFTGLAPGEYRVTAVRGTGMEVTEAQLAGVVESGTTVKVGQNGFQNVTVEITELK